MQGRRIPEHGRGELGRNAWEWFNAEKGEKSGTFVRTETRADAFQGRNRKARRKAISLKRKGLV